VMEQMAAAGPRVQLALGRVQLQEQRINNLIRRLDEVRGTLGGAQTTYDRMRQEKSRIEEALRDPGADGPHLEQLKDRQVQMTQELASAQRTLQRAIADEASMTSELSVEQARWTELNQRMEALEASLGQR
jgi:predicted nuclease with TOPRIM domain